MCRDGEGEALVLKGGTARGSFPFWDLFVLRSWTQRRWSRSGNETEGRAHHPLLTQEETIQLITLISFDHASRVSGIVPIKRFSCVMRGDKPTTSFHQWKERDAYFTLHFSLSISLTLCSTHPTTTPSLQHDGQSIARQSALWCWSHLHQAKKEKKNLRHDMMTYPGGMIHCSLGLMGEGSQPSVCVCVCVSASRIW